MIPLIAAGISAVQAQNGNLTLPPSDAEHMAGNLPNLFIKDSADGSPYLVKGWLRGTVELTSHRRLPERGQTLFFNYDKMNERLYLTDGIHEPWTYDADSLSGFDLVDTNAVYDFEKFPLISAKHIVQVLVRSDSGYSLYKRGVTVFIPADYKSDGFRTMGSKSDRYEDRDEYYLVYPGRDRLRKMTLNVRDIKKALPSESARIDKFFAEDRGRVTEQVFATLLKYLNG